ncbi:hypothetical protein DNX69_16025 [Rhodopseudomonas palustris]|uniref:Uncharacterized protein n=1 Tax=Rhodopseudomonas palustris TaxID=1076 RepID=A0A323UEU4_RHOPL|nr:hypothetical protein [Rhodopseudomonas palustris]PZA10849.1 hypothetical protein DNX69_16025 [Rhodopseudomonas palustris]
MRSHPALRAAPLSSRIHPALRGFADECRETVVRILAYVGALALIGIVVFYAANPLTDAAITAATDATAPGWSVAEHSSPAFAISQLDWPGKVETQQVLRHPGGGRKDILRIAAAGAPTAAEIEIYRFGREASGQAAEAELAARMEPEGAGGIETAGVIETKFGPVTLFAPAGGLQSDGACLGFIKPIEAAGLRISGFSCRGATGPERRAAAACLLDRLVLLSGDAATAAAFAQAELRRGRCTPNHIPTASAPADWVTGLQDPVLRGRL